MSYGNSRDANSGKILTVILCVAGLVFLACTALGWLR